MRLLMNANLKVGGLDILQIENRVPYKMMITINIAVLEVHITIGEPTIQVITNRATTRGTPSYQRGATRDKSLWIEV